MNLRQVGLALVVALVTGCSADGSSAPARTHAATPAPPTSYKLAPSPTVTLAPGARMPTTMPAARGLVTVPHGASVQEIAHGRSRICVGVQDLMPGAACSGIDLIGFEWSNFPDSQVGRDGLRSGSFDVVGRYDGRKLTVESATVHRYPRSPGPSHRRRRTPCAPPGGGWRVVDPDPRLAAPAALGRASYVARGLRGYAGLWIDHLGKIEGSRVRVVLNVAVTGGKADAERALRRSWGGALCVSTAKHSLYALSKIADRFSGIPGWQGSSISSDDHVVVDVTYDDGNLQAWADQKYGRSLVRIRSVLKPVVVVP